MYLSELQFCLDIWFVGHMAILFQVFLRKRRTVFHGGCTNLHSHQQCRRVGSLFSAPSLTFVIFNDGLV